MTVLHAPAVALPNPLIGHPMTTGTRSRPMTGGPFIASPGPVPISGQPHLARHGRFTDDFLLRRRRRDHHHAIDIMTLVRGHRATKQSQATAQAADRSRIAPDALVHLEQQDNAPLAGAPSAG